jgi:hypothetical protein
LLMRPFRFSGPIESTHDESGATHRLVPPLAERFRSARRQKIPSVQKVVYRARCC